MMNSAMTDADKRYGGLMGPCGAGDCQLGLCLLSAAVIDGADLLLQADSSPVPVQSLSV